MGGIEIVHGVLLLRNYGHRMIVCWDFWTLPLPVALGLDYSKRNNLSEAFCGGKREVSCSAYL